MTPRPPPHPHLGKPSPGAVLLTATATAFAAGALLWSAGSGRLANACWTAGIAVALAASLWWILSGLRQRKLGVDLIAPLALVGTVLVGEYAAGSLIGVMLATGRLLDASASRRARKDLSALVNRFPTTARRRRGAEITVIDVDAIEPWDILAVAPGEIVPADGRLRDNAVLDESALTGEPLPRHVRRGGTIRSGAVNAGAAFDMIARSPSADSTNAGIVRLAGAAAAERAPVVRLADRLAILFIPVTLTVATVSWWISGSPTRAVAILVVATPCPLLLAAPIAIVAGLSRASRSGVIIRDGGALETLGRARTLLIDKTGTLTTGRPEQVEVTAAPGEDADGLLRLSASVEQMSPHVFATAIVSEAARRELPLTVPTGVHENAGTRVRASPAWSRTVSSRSVRETPRFRSGRARWYAAVSWTGPPSPGSGWTIAMRAPSP